jgi:Uma2 family endonuclease
MTAIAQKKAERYRVGLTDPWPSSLSWSVDRYRKAYEAGVIGEDEPFELLNGSIVERMGSNPPHAACIQIVMEYFYERYFKKYGLRMENAVQLSDDSLPQPDFAVVTYRVDHYARIFPQAKDVQLLVEVADSSLSIDRNQKKVAYAKAGIPEYWIVNLKDRQLEVHLRPSLTGGTYAAVTHYGDSEEAETQFAGRITVADLLPPPVTDDQS